MNGAREYADRTFSAPRWRLDDIAEAVMKWASHGAGTRVLDIGCGTGSHLFALAPLMPGAELHGVDVSSASVRLAEDAREGVPFGKRLHFHVADYLGFEAGKFDVVVSDTTLHLIDSPTDRLFAKVRRDLAPEGVLVATLPYDCVYNRLLWSVRRVARLFRGRVMDEVIFRVARLLHSGDFSDEMLRERVCYMYYLPMFRMSDALAAELGSRFGLRLAHRQPLRQTSWAMPRHNLYVFRASASGGPSGVA